MLATTESPVDTLEHHAAIRDSGWRGRVITAYRPDAVIDPEHEAFRGALERFGEITGEDVYSLAAAISTRIARAAPTFAQAGATSTDHGHPTAATADLSTREAERLFERVVGGDFTPPTPSCSAPRCWSRWRG